MFEMSIVRQISRLTMWDNGHNVVSIRQHMQNTLYAIALLFVHGWISQKWLKFRIYDFHHTVDPKMQKQQSKM